MSTSVQININTIIGGLGSANGEFNYPSGVVVANSKLYVVDKQNNRIQRFDLLGNFEAKFGSLGTGNNNFKLPEGICTDGSNLFIVDSANHRIKIHAFDGTYVGEFGTFGSGFYNFNYPTDITYFESSLYIADRSNNRIVKYTSYGAYQLQWGAYGSGALLFKFPEGIVNFNNSIVVVDSASKIIKYYDKFGNYEKLLSLFNTTYPTSADNANDQVLIIVDNQGSTLYFYDTDNNLISSYDTGLSFPDSIYYNDEKLYLTDSANHRVIIYDFFIEVEVPTFISKILKATKQLYPTGRSWLLNKDTVFEKLHDGLSYSESRAVEDCTSILDSILPDNDNFSEDDATSWERALGLFDGLALTLDERKAIILRKMQHPGNIPARQHYLYLQGQLQAAGFDVYVHENLSGAYNPVPSLYGNFYYDGNVYGNNSPAVPIIANYTDASRENYSVGGVDNLVFTFFIGGQIFPNSTSVPASREREFRELILKIKPAQSVGFLLINYT
jgi:hypothetical protein